MSPATARIASADRRASAQQDPQRIQATRGSSDNDHVPALCHARALPSFASFTPPSRPRTDNGLEVAPTQQIIRAGAATALHRTGSPRG